MSKSRQNKTGVSVAAIAVLSIVGGLLVASALVVYQDNYKTTKIDRITVTKTTVTY